MTKISIVVIRMSQGGFFSKLKNKIAFKVNQTVEDPDAEKYAKEKEKTDTVTGIPQVKPLEQMRQERMVELRKDPTFATKFDELVKAITENAVNKQKRAGKNDKDATEEGQKYINGVIIPEFNIMLDDKASGNKILSTLQDRVDQLQDDSDPSKISFSRIVKKIWRYIQLIVEKGFFPFMACIMAMYVSNEMIMYPAPIRVIFFIVTIFAFMFFQPAAIGLILFYIGKAGYNYYVNEMIGKEKKRIMPTLFAWLPITTYQPEGNLEAFFLYPFTYPKTVADKEELPKIMEEYQASLDQSFPYLEKIRSLPFVAEGLALIKENMENLHKEAEPETPEPEKPASLVLTNQVRSNFNKLTAPSTLPSTITPPMNNKNGKKQANIGPSPYVNNTAQASAPLLPGNEQASPSKIEEVNPEEVKEDVKQNEPRLEETNPEEEAKQNESHLEEVNPEEIKEEVNQEEVASEEKPVNVSANQKEKPLPTEEPVVTNENPKKE
jgi:hypothetical protein